MKNNKKAFVVFLFNITAVILSFIFCLCPSHATNYYWNVDTGYWGDAANWNTNSVPFSNSSESLVYITNTTDNNATVYVSGADDFSTNQLNIYGTGAQTATLSISSGSILANGYAPDTGWDTSDPFNVGTNGIVNQTGGTIRVARTSGAVNVNSGGAYNLESGTLQGGIIVIDTGGVFNQSGGLVKVGDMGAIVHGGGVYNLTNGTLNTDVYALAVEGTFNQYGGRVDLVTNGVVLDGRPHQIAPAGEATYNQFGGEVRSAYGIHLMGSSTYNLMGGSLILTGVRESFIGEGGILNYSGGSLSLIHRDYGNDSPLINNGTVNLMGNGTRTISGPGEIINNGTFKVTNTTAVYSGTFTNNGAYISDPATQYFNDLIVGYSGYLVGQKLDIFNISGDFINNSSMNMDWQTSQAYLAFLNGADNLHDFYLTGADFGANMLGYSNNFAWGVFDVTGDIVNFFDGNSELGAALYLREILGLDIAEDMLITNLFGFNGLNIYYMANLPDNMYLNGLTYELSGGGHLRPVPEPEPTTMLLLGLGLLGLAGIRRKLQ